MNRRSFFAKLAGAFVAVAVTTRLKVPEVVVQEEFPTLRSVWYTNRRTFYQYPNGASPLVGLLALMDNEPTNPKFNWWQS